MTKFFTFFTFKVVGFPANSYVAKWIEGVTVQIDVLTHTR